MSFFSIIDSHAWRLGAETMGALAARDRGELSKAQCAGRIRVATIRAITKSDLRRRKATCAACEGSFALSRLEIDHVDGRTWSPRKFDSLKRSLKYVAEYAAGVRLRALCRSCNAKDGRARQTAANRDFDKAVAYARVRKEARSIALSTNHQLVLYRQAS